MEEEKNEFEDLDVHGGPPTTEATDEFAEVPETTDDLIAAGAPGVAYDWKNATEGVKAPPRKGLDGQTVTIKKADIILPPREREWSKTRAGDKEFKFCSFILYYDVDGQQEFYNGIRVFKREEGGVDKYSHPTITRDRKSQASALLGAYADYKGKDINEVSLREFLSFLNSTPKAIIEAKGFKNPTTEEEVIKNMVGSFVNP